MESFIIVVVVTGIAAFGWYLNWMSSVGSNRCSSGTFLMILCRSHSYGVCAAAAIGIVCFAVALAGIGSAGAAFTLVAPSAGAFFLRAFMAVLSLSWFIGTGVLARTRLPNGC